MTSSTKEDSIKRIAGELKALDAFQGISDEDLDWFVEHTEEAHYSPGEIIVTEGAPAEFMFVILQGEFTARQESAGPDGPVFHIQAGAVTGLLPYSRMKVSKITGRADTNLRLLKLHSRHFPDMLHRIPVLGERLVGMLTDRVREFTRLEQQRDKLAALGKLSAGLAHELNNPSAAAVRSAEALLECLDRLRKLERDPSLNEANCEQISLVEEAIRKEHKPAAFQDELDRSDREDSLITWLEANSIKEPWKLAPMLVEANLEKDHLQRLQAVAGPAFPSELMRFATMLEMEKLAEQIGHSTKRISSLVRAIKEYSYMDQSPVQPVDIVHGIENTLTILDHKLRKGITVQRVFAPDLPHVTANGSELNQVWTNLIDNAADALKNKGVLSIRAARDADSVVVEIGDNGPGIPKDLQSHIFEQFFTTKPVGQGTGLGLDAVRRIVRKLNGTISFTSVPGDTRFQVRIPVAGLGKGE
ncbi:MAG TPA: ATP-binding protein [Candidatus Sulfotelmatobacter sp.]|nr:ATP-binding protein [Candidatus Sulfotelmatobacter sp.]